MDKVGSKVKRCCASLLFQHADFQALVTSDTLLHIGVDNQWLCLKPVQQLLLDSSMDLISLVKVFHIG